MQTLCNHLAPQMASPQPLVTPRTRRAPTQCESRAELAAIAAIADDIGRRNGTALNPRRRPPMRELPGASATEAPPLASRNFADPRVSFSSCAREIDLQPHPSLLGMPLQAVDAPASGLRAAPVEDRTYRMLTPQPKR